MQHRVDVKQIENLWGKENETFEFISKFKKHVHISFRGEEQFARWEKLDQKKFLEDLKIEGTLKKILIYDEIIIETV